MLSSSSGLISLIYVSSALCLLETSLYELSLCSTSSTSAIITAATMFFKKPVSGYYFIGCSTTYLLLSFLIGGSFATDFVLSFLVGTYLVLSFLTGDSFITDSLLSFLSSLSFGFSSSISGVFLADSLFLSFLSFFFFSGLDY